jgi:hypothetical protein
MPTTGLSDHILNIKVQAHSGIEFVETNLDLRAQVRERFNSLQQLVAQLLLCSVGQSASFANGDFEDSDHRGTIALHVFRRDR